MFSAINVPLVFSKIHENLKIRKAKLDITFLNMIRNCTVERVVQFGLGSCLHNITTPTVRSSNFDSLCAIQDQRSGSIFPRRRPIRKLSISPGELVELWQALLIVKHFTFTCMWQKTLDNCDVNTLGYCSGQTSTWPLRSSFCREISAQHLSAWTTRYEETLEMTELRHHAVRVDCGFQTNTTRL